MRLHRLTVEAFGPFAERVDLDLDTVATSGVFLIHGPTGAGKTSLLDALCFALYADVPGARTRQGLRSDHAPAEAVPWVQVEFTAAGRRLRVRRSPEHRRPKRRGTGTVRVPATVALSEHDGTGWQPVSTRHDEVGEVVNDVLGMGLSQFAQVVLLPQGKFADFLRAGNEERRQVLERLFEIGSYGDIETWFEAERKRTAREVTQLRAALDIDRARLGDLVLPAVAPPSAADPAAVAPAGDPAVGPSAPAAVVGAVDASSLPDVVAGWLDAAAQQVTTTLAALDTAEAAAERAAAQHTRAAALVALKHRAEQAQERIDALVVDEPAQQQRRRELADARRAATLAGHVAAAEDSRRRVAAAAAATRLVGRELGRWGLKPPTARQADDLAAQVRDRSRTIAELSRVTAAAHDTNATLRGHEADATAAAAALATAIADVTGRRVTVAMARALVARSEAAETALARAAQETLRLGRLRDQLGDLAQARDRQLDADAAVTEATAGWLSAREDLVAVQERRLAGMAGEMASALSDGQPCAVCGATEHPEPALGSSLPVSSGEVARARNRVQDRDDERERALRHQTAGHTRIEVLQAEIRRELGLAACDAVDVAVLRARVMRDLTRVQADLVMAKPDADLTQARRAALHTAEQDAQAANRSFTAAAQASAAAAALVVHSRGLVHAQVRDVADHLAAHDGCPCLAEPASGEEATEGTPLVARLAHAETVVASHEALDRQAATLVGAAAEERRCIERADQASDALASAAHQVGFDSVEQALASRRDAGIVTSLERRIRDHDSDLRLAGSALSQDGVAAAAWSPMPDLAPLEHTASLARHAAIEARDEYREADRRHRAVARLAPEVQRHARALVAATHRADEVGQVADLVLGSGSDNLLRMRLTSFVLAARLEAVVALANERLAQMGAGRYLLEHTDARAARGARSGLGLRVLDQWTGQTRETATLSGGESFMVSLSLALGLADAVQAESGGRDLATLFVDEGFGSLDDESLDEVMDLLDQLREGGRAVGVISHVSEMRTRIPSQVTVTKTTAGSRVQIRLDGAGATEAPDRHARPTRRPA